MKLVTFSKCYVPSVVDYIWCYDRLFDGGGAGDGGATPVYNHLKRLQHNAIVMPNKDAYGVNSSIKLFKYSRIYYSGAY